MNSYILKPIITEKSISEANTKNKYTFLVTKNANKILVKKEATTKFEVKVLAVNIANILGKNVKFGKKRITGNRSGYKKAVLTLQKGSKIPLFELK